VNFQTVNLHVSQVNQHPFQSVFLLQLCLSLLCVPPFADQTNPLGEAVGDVSGRLLSRGIEGLFPGQQQEDPFTRFLRLQQAQPGRIVNEITGGF